MLGTDKQNQVWAIIPAAGIGSRMQNELPKQYLQLCDQPILSHTLKKISSISQIKEITVAINQYDDHWQTIPKPNNININTVAGGKERCDSVFNALIALEKKAKEGDWVLVHDAARPCVRPKDIEKLLFDIATHDVGGILALPINDTVKKSDSDQQINSTLDRKTLWRALTPQVFRYELLLKALKNALNSDQLVTDESQAIESLGLKPLLVAGHADNIKITTPEDLLIAELYLQAREKNNDK